MTQTSDVLRMVLLVAVPGFSVAADSSSSANAQESADNPPPSGIVGEEPEGRRLGNMPNDQIRQFQMRKACEEDLPECLPHIRAQLEEERRNRLWMGVGIGGVLLLIYLLAKRESDRKKAMNRREARRHKKIGERVAKKWRKEAQDPYADADPLADSEPAKK